MKNFYELNDDIKLNISPNCNVYNSEFILIKVDKSFICILSDYDLNNTETNLLNYQRT